MCVYIYFILFLLTDLRERGIDLFHLLMYSLAASVCPDRGDWTHNLGLLERRSNQVSYPGWGPVCIYILKPAKTKKTPTLCIYQKGFEEGADISPLDPSNWCSEWILEPIIDVQSNGPWCGVKIKLHSWFTRGCIDTIQEKSFKSI